MFKNKLIVTAAAILAASLWGCGSNYTSGGDQTGAESTLASAATVGMDNCLTCHSAFSTLVMDYLVSRHGNHMDAAAKVPNDVEVPGADPSPGSCAYECHDPFNDRDRLNLAEIQAAVSAFGNDGVTTWDTVTTIGSLVGCEGCHGGGQYHNGIALGIPFATPGPKQCGQCHYLDNSLAKAEWIAEGYYPHHTTSSSGNNVRRNITDTHIDNPNTTGAIEGYNLRYSQQNGCVDCHFNGHLFDLEKNYDWGHSKHGGQIKTLKDATLAAGLPVGATDAERLALLAAVTATAVTTDSGDAWQHYDWDDTASRGSCQVCHTSTGIANFLENPTGYDLTGKGNNYSHLDGWVADDPNTPEVVDNVSSGQNEMLYCWGCHADSKGGLRNPGAIPLDFTYNGALITQPEARKSNVCVKCHSGRGNNDSIRTGSRSTRFAGHHAPTAGTLYAQTTHIAYEFTGLDYTGTPTHAAIDVGSSGRGPCVNCHLGGSTEAAAEQQNHTFEATEHDGAGAITTIVHSTTCNTAACHNGDGVTTGMTVASLQATKDGFEATKTILAGLVGNTIPNYLGLSVTANYRTVPLDAYGAFQNNIYMSEEPCSFVHNNLYSRRVLFDSIDFMLDGTLDGNIDITGLGTAPGLAADYLNGQAPASVDRP